MRPHRAPRAVHRVLFEQLRDAEQNSECRGLDVQADPRRGENRRSHQQVDVEGPAAGRAVTAPDDRQSGREHRTQKSHVRDGERERGPEFGVHRRKREPQHESDRQKRRPDPRRYRACPRPHLGGRCDVDPRTAAVGAGDDVVPRSLDSCHHVLYVGAPGVVAHTDHARRRPGVDRLHPVDTAETRLDRSRTRGAVHLRNREPECPFLVLGSCRRLLVCHRLLLGDRRGYQFLGVFQNRVRSVPTASTLRSDWPDRAGENGETAHNGVGAPSADRVRPVYCSARCASARRRR